MGAKPKRGKIRQYLILPILSGVVPWGGVFAAIVYVNSLGLKLLPSFLLITIGNIVQMVFWGIGFHIVQTRLGDEKLLVVAIIALVAAMLLGLRKIFGVRTSNRMFPVALLAARTKNWMFVIIGGHVSLALIAIHDRALAIALFWSYWHAESSIGLWMDMGSSVEKAIFITIISSAVATLNWFWLASRAGPIIRESWNGESSLP